MMTKVYIAGKIYGDNDYRQKFAAAEEKMKEAGHVVLNPAALPHGLSLADYMRICFAMIDCADRVMFLPDWKSSKGARLEWSYCLYTGKAVGYL